MILKHLLFFLSIINVYPNVIRNCDLCQLIITTKNETDYRCGTDDVKELDETLNKLLFFENKIPNLNGESIKIDIFYVCINEIFFKHDKLIRCFDKCNKKSDNIFKENILSLNKTNNLVFDNFSSIDIKNFYIYLNDLFNLSIDKTIYFINKICVKTNLEFLCFTKKF